MSDQGGRDRRRPVSRIRYGTELLRLDGDAPVAWARSGLTQRQVVLALHVSTDTAPRTGRGELRPLAALAPRIGVHRVKTVRRHLRALVRAGWLTFLDYGRVQLTVPQLDHYGEGGGGGER